jgi:hypothetical protein
MFGSIMRQAVRIHFHARLVAPLDILAINHRFQHQLEYWRASLWGKQETSAPEQSSQPQSWITGRIFADPVVYT